MDREIVEQKLESLRRCLMRIEVKTPATADELAADIDLQNHLSDFSAFAKVVARQLDGQ